MSIENEESKKPDEPRSPGVTDRDTLASEKPDEEVEVVRRPIVLDVTDVSAKPNEPRSPGVTDPGISLEEIIVTRNKETDTVRKPIILDAETEPEDEE